MAGGSLDSAVGNAPLRILYKWRVSARLMISGFFFYFFDEPFKLRSICHYTCVQFKNLFVSLMDPLCFPSTSVFLLIDSEDISFKPKPCYLHLFLSVPALPSLSLQSNFPLNLHSPLPDFTSTTHYSVLASAIATRILLIFSTFNSSFTNHFSPTLLGPYFSVAVFCTFLINSHLCLFIVSTSPSFLFSSLDRNFGVHLIIILLF